MCALEAGHPTRKPGRPRDPDLEVRRKAEILTAAAGVFAADGYAAADVQRIADRLGVGKGTVYRYFASKEELFLAAVDHGLAELTAAIDAILADPALDPLDQMRGAVRAYLGFFAGRPEMAELFIQERAAFGGTRTPRYFVADRKDECETRGFMQALMTAGRVRAMDPERMLAVLGDVLYGTVISNHLSGRPADPGEQADAILDVVFIGILADAERKRHLKRTAEGRA